MENYSLSHVGQLAARLGAPIVVYDLECTTFRGRANFGITEVGALCISETGGLEKFGGLVNPERAIDPNVASLTGISQSMVRDKASWGTHFAGQFKQLAQGSAWVTGFNNNTFDNPAVIDMNSRYGQPIEKFTKTFDVRKLHKKLSGSKTQGGKLIEIAAMYGVLPQGALHRAMADVILTAELLEAVVQAFGIDAVLEVIHDKAKPKSKSLSGRTFTSEALVLYVSKKDRLTLEEIAAAFDKEVKAVSFEVGKAIDERLVNPDTFAHAATQEWLCETLIDIDATLLTQGKLKPIHEHVNLASPVGHVDYVQLRIGLLTAGVTWSSLRPH